MTAENGFELPPEHTTWWTPLRKASVVAHIKKGTLTTQEAISRYKLSDEELSEWKTDFGRGGVPALRVVKRRKRHSAGARIFGLVATSA